MRNICNHIVLLVVKYIASLVVLALQIGVASVSPVMIVHLCAHLIFVTPITTAGCVIFFSLGTGGVTKTCEFSGKLQEY